MAKIDITGKTKEERMDIARETAMNYFKKGLNCTECVLRAFLDIHDTGLPDDVITLGTGFGGGIGGTKNMCGAVSGAVMALGMIKGRRDPMERGETAECIKQLRQEIYPVFESLVDDIEKEYGTLICRELSDPFGDFEGKPRRKNCMKMIGFCAAMAEKHTV